MITWPISLLVGVVTSVLSGFGIGGGTLLLIHMTIFAGVPQNLAQDVNLPHLLSTTTTTLSAHIGDGYIDRQIV